MKRIPLMSFLLLAGLFLRPGTVCVIAQQQQVKTNAAPEVHFTSPLKGWFVIEESLQDYEVGVDNAIKHGGNASVHVRSKASSDPPRAIVLRQSISAEPFRGQRVRLSGWIRGEKVEDWAGLWLRVDGENGQRISMDNMRNRPVKGVADWRQYELVLEVPEGAHAVSFGMVLAGKGQVWADDLKIEKAPSAAITTENYGKSEARPDDVEYNRRREVFARQLAQELKSGSAPAINLDFESPPQ